MTLANAEAEIEMTGVAFTDDAAGPRSLIADASEELFEAALES